MRGCLFKAKTKRGLKPGEFAWRFVVPNGRRPDGRPKQKSMTLYGTRKQVEQRRTEILGELYRGEFVEPSKVTLGEWLDRWLEMAVKPPMLAQGTYECYGSMIRNHLKEQLGPTRLQLLSVLQIERHYAELGQKLEPASVCLVHAVLLRALDAAISAGMLRVNLAKRASNKPKVLVGEDVLHNVWDKGDARAFLAAAKQAGNAQWAAFFALALDGGPRKSELLGLQWKDIDGKLLRVERQVITSGKQRDRAISPVFSLPKGKRARSFELSAETLALLTEHKKQQAELKLKNRPAYKDHGLIFAQSWEQVSSRNSVLGAPLTLSAVHRQLATFINTAGVKSITMHGLRHTCATLLLAAGVPAHVVQRRLGHRKVEITLNLYAHVLPSMQEDAAARLAVLLHG